jgi:hypothetical protein
VAHAFGILREETERALALVGVQRPADLRPEHVETVSSGR